jgi:hypothetical protein
MLDKFKIVLRPAFAEATAGKACVMREHEGGRGNVRGADLRTPPPPAPASGGKR